MVTGFDIIGSNNALQDHWLRRVLALIIDGIIIGVIYALIFFLMIPLWMAGFYDPFFLIGSVILGLIMLFYFILFDIAMGGTPGKKLLSMEVVGTEKKLDFVAAFLRNISKIYWLFLLIDWAAGMFTEGDPRQKYLDRIAKTTVQRTDDKAHMEQQFKQMAYIPPHPTYQPPPAQPYQPPPAQQPPAQPQQQQPQPGAWPHQEQQQQASSWPQHEPGQPAQQPAQQPAPQQQDIPRFCQNCGGPLTPGPDGRPTCSRCGKVY